MGLTVISAPRRGARNASEWTTEHSVAGESEVRAIAYSPRGDQMSFGGTDRKLTTLSTITWEVLNLMELEEHLCTMAYCPVGEQQLLSIGCGMRLSMFSTQNRDAPHSAFEERHVVEVGSDVFTCAYSPSGGRLSYGGAGRELTTLDTVSWETLHSTGELGTELRCCAYSPTLEQLSYGTMRDLVTISTETWEVLHHIEIGASVRAIAYSPAGDQLSYGGADEALTSLSADTWEALHSIAVGGQVRTCAYSPSGDQLAFDSGDQLTLVAVSPWALLHSSEVGASTKSCAYSLDGNELSYGTRRLVTVSTQTWEEVRSVDVGAEVRVCAYCPQGGELSYGGHDNRLTVLSTNTGQVLFRRELRGWLCALAYSPKGDLLSYGGRDDKLTTLQRQTEVTDAEEAWKVLREIRVGAEVRTCAFSPKGGMLTYGGRDKKLTTVSLETWETVFCTTAEKEVCVCTYSPDGGQLAFGGLDKKLTIICTATWQVLYSVKADGHIFALAYSHSGDHLSYGGLDNRLTTLSAQKGAGGFRVLHAVEVGVSVRCCAYSPIGDQLCYGEEEKVCVLDTFGSPHGARYHDLGRASPEAVCEMLEESPVLLRVAFRELARRGRWDALGMVCTRNRPGLALLRQHVDRQEAEEGEKGGTTVLDQLVVEMDRGAVVAILRLLATAPIVAPNLAPALKGICERMPEAIAPALHGLALRHPRYTGSIGHHAHLPKNLPLVRGSASGDAVAVWLNERHRGRRGIAVVARRTACPGLGRRNLLTAVINTHRKEAFGSEAMELVVDGLWMEVGPMFYIRFLLYIVFLGAISCVAAELVVSLPGAVVVVATPREQAAEVAVWDIVAAVLAIAKAGLSSVEIRGAKGLGWRWSALSLVQDLMVMITIWAKLWGPQFFEEEEQGGTEAAEAGEGGVARLLRHGRGGGGGDGESDGGGPIQTGGFYRGEEASGASRLLELRLYCACATSLLAYFNVLQYLRGMDATASLVMMLLEIAKDIRPFMLILGVVLGGFGLVFWILLTPARGFGSLAEALFSVGLMGLVGDFDRPVLEGSASPNFVKGLFCLLLVLVLVLMLNLLIALMNSSYEKVMDTFVETHRVERAKVIVQQLNVLAVLAPNRYRRLEESTIWFHQLRPELVGERDGPDGVEEEKTWVNQMHAIRSALAISSKATLGGMDLHQKATKRDLLAAFSRMDARLHEVWAANARLDEKLTSIGEQLVSTSKQQQDANGNDDDPTPQPEKSARHQSPIFHPLSSPLGGMSPIVPLLPEHLWHTTNTSSGRSGGSLGVSVSNSVFQTIGEAGHGLVRTATEATSATLNPLAAMGFRLEGVVRPPLRAVHVMPGARKVWAELGGVAEANLQEGHVVAPAAARPTRSGLRFH